jgi:hypothetical protein
MMKHPSFHKNLRVLFFVIALWGFFIESFAASFPSDKASFNQCWECIDQSEEDLKWGIDHLDGQRCLFSCVLSLNSKT